MIAMNLFRSRQDDSENATMLESPEIEFTWGEPESGAFDEKLAHLSQQKELQTLAIKEMYQFLCKLDTSFREENQKLRDLIELEQARSNKLVEITKGLWDIIELMDDGNPRPDYLATKVSMEVHELQEFDIEIMDESRKTALENSDYPQIQDIASMMVAAV